LSKNKLDLECHEHFQEMRKQIEMQRDKINDICMEMIETTQKYEKSYLKNLNEKLDTCLKSFEIKSVDEGLRELEETFRNPNLLIKSIKEMYQKQEEFIQTLQSKLNGLNQIIEDLKASNQFKPNLSFNKDLFGKLNLNDPFRSQILREKQSLELLELCEFNSGDRFKLLYRASEHGFGPNHFHSKCDWYPNTLTIFKASKSSYIFGGFTTKTWGGPDGYKSDPNAFLFSLTNKDNQSCKMNIDPNKHQYAIRCYSELGPTFGCGHDVFIDSNANANTSSYSNLGDAYKHPQYAKGTYQAKSFLAGFFQFQLSEIEVYQKVNSWDEIKIKEECV
jgi:hypothetical protein